MAICYARMFEMSIVQKWHVQPSVIDLSRPIAGKPAEESVVLPCVPPIVEARAAVAYWAAWTPVTIRFARKDQATVPDHWRTFGTRASALSGTSRAASNPINALLNYAYAIL